MGVCGIVARNCVKQSRCHLGGEWDGSRHWRIRRGSIYPKGKGRFGGGVVPVSLTDVFECIFKNINVFDSCMKN